MAPTIKKSIATGFGTGELYGILTGIQADLADLKSKFDAHVHAGVTAGAASTAVPTTLTLAQQTAVDKSL